MTLKEVRISKGYSQREASEFLNIPLRSYKRYENEKEYEKSNIYLSAIDQLSKCKKIKPKLKPKIKKSITIVGAGFVGLANAKVLSKRFSINLVEINPEKVDEIKKNTKFSVFNDVSEVPNLDYVMICLPTDFDEKTNLFNTKQIEKELRKIYKINKKATVILRSTVSIGYTRLTSIKMNKNIVYMPEFLREKTAELDAKRPCRFLVGADRITDKIIEVIDLMKDCLSVPLNTEIVSSKEAEMIKLYSNAYLAMRVAFMNDLEDFARKNKADPRKIIKSLGKDSRIGDYYNNPSFGYSGYCLPKDVKVLGFETNSTLINSINKSNEERINKVAKEIIDVALGKNKNPKVLFFGLNNKRDIVINSLYENVSKTLKNCFGCGEDVSSIADDYDLIVANEITELLKPHKDKVFSKSIM